MNSEDILKGFGNHLKATRNTKGLSQEKLAHIADLDRTYVSGVERGLRNISLVNICKLAKALDIPPTELFKFGEH